MKRFIKKSLVAMGILLLPQVQSFASSHREAPMIANDPQADNTDLYVFSQSLRFKQDSYHRQF